MNSFHPSGSRPLSNCAHHETYFSNSCFSTKFALSLSRMVSSRYWYLNFFLCLHSLALCLLRSSLYVSVAGSPPPRPPRRLLTGGSTSFPGKLDEYWSSRLLVLIVLPWLPTCRLLFPLFLFTLGTSIQLLIYN